VLKFLYYDLANAMTSACKRVREDTKPHSKNAQLDKFSYNTRSGNGMVHSTALEPTLSYFCEHLIHNKCYKKSLVTRNAR